MPIRDHIPDSGIYLPVAKSLLLTHVPVPNMLWSALHEAGMLVQMRSPTSAKVPGAIVTVDPATGQVSINGPLAGEVLAILQPLLDSKQTSEAWIDGKQTLSGGGFFMPVFQGVNW